MTSISSEPFGHLEDDLNEDVDSNKKGEMALQDGVIKTYDDHEDSVSIISLVQTCSFDSPQRAELYNGSVT